MAEARVSVVNQAGRSMSGTETPTIFHFTHWKAGSQWVRGVFEAACPGRVVEALPRNAHVLEAPLKRGAIYSPVYMRRQVFESSEASRASAQVRLFVMRDLRDALVSWYFSLCVSHQDIPGTMISSLREALRSRSFEEGMLYLVRGDGAFTGLGGHAAIQTSWLNGADLLVRYEDLIEDEMRWFGEILARCGIEMAGDRLEEVVRSQSFESLSGRKRGEEDVGAHQRKGVRGDWKNHFTPAIADAVKERFGSVLIETGYERDLSW